MLRRGGTTFIRASEVKSSKCLQVLFPLLKSFMNPLIRMFHSEVNTTLLEAFSISVRLRFAPTSHILCESEQRLDDQRDRLIKSFLLSEREEVKEAVSSDENICFLPFQSFNLFISFPFLLVLVLFPFPLLHSFVSIQREKPWNPHV